MRSKRIDLIEAYILSEKTVSIDHLCEKFQVSKNTIRRDIEELLSRGTIKKVYGGVTSSSASNSRTLTTFAQRTICLPEQKDKICKAAAQFVEEGDILFIDSGTTCQNLINYLFDYTLTILTNSLEVLSKAVSYPKLTVICLPGKLKRETLSFVGTEAADYLKSFNIKKAFMASTGVSVENGLTNASMDEYVIKKAVIKQSKTRFLLSDHTKFGVFALMTYCGLEKIQHIITDDLPDENFQKYCMEKDIFIHKV